MVDFSPFNHWYVFFVIRIIYTESERRRRMDQQKIGKFIAERRKNANLTQEEVGRRIGASKGYISRVERGLTVPTVATLYKLVAAMGLKIVFLPK
jgi:DNA-binding XRE family transcriptional regulator